MLTMLEFPRGTFCFRRLTNRRDTCLQLRTAIVRLKIIHDVGEIHNNEEVGVKITLGGSGLIEECWVYKNKLSGVEVDYQGNPTLRNCKINLNRQKGVWVHSKGTGTFEGCDLTGNLEGAWEIHSACKIQLIGKKLAS